MVSSPVRGIKNGFTKAKRTSTRFVDVFSPTKALSVASTGNGKSSLLKWGAKRSRIHKVWVLEDHEVVTTATILVDLKLDDTIDATPQDAEIIDEYPSAPNSFVVTVPIIIRAIPARLSAFKPYFNFVRASALVSVLSFASGGLSAFKPYFKG